MRSASPPLDAARTDILFHALGDPNRRRIVALLAERPASVSELATSLAISKTAIGQHLAVLERAQLAHSSKVGRVRTCRFDPAGLAVLQQWIDHHRHEWTERLDRLEDLLTNVKVTGDGE